MYSMYSNVHEKKLHSYKRSAILSKYEFRLFWYRQPRAALEFFSLINKQQLTSIVIFV
jgi:hypothetical protein